jgi:hypothetical protein
VDEGRDHVVVVAGFVGTGDVMEVKKKGSSVVDLLHSCTYTLQE